MKYILIKVVILHFFYNPALNPWNSQLIILEICNDNMFPGIVIQSNVGTGLGSEYLARHFICDCNDTKMVYDERRDILSCETGSL